MADEQHYLYITSSYPTETYIKDGDTTNPITVNGNEITVTPGDYVLVKNYQYDDPVVHEKYNDQGYSHVSIWYVYTANNSWLYAGAQYAYNSQGNPYVDGEGKNLYNSSGHSLHFLDHEDNYPAYSEIIGNTNSTIISCDNPMWQPHDYNNKIPIKDYIPNYVEYGYEYTDERQPDRALNAPLTTQAQFGDMACLCCIDEYGDENTLQFFYQYPGVWIEKGHYPDLTVQVPEPKYKGHVQLKWTDPPDITDWKPTPATWEGTVIVRKENSAPLHRWDGDKVVRTTTRDKYKSKPYKDEDIETNKVYYYAFMPYYTKIDDPQHPIRYYTFTKCIRVETGTISYIPEIIKIDMNEDVATITYAITLPATGPYDTAKLYGKKDGNPACDNTDDIVLDISQVDDQVVVPDIDGDYFFCIQVANGTDTFTSDVVGCYGENPIPPEYRQYIDLINGCNGEGLDFFWKNYSVTGASRLTAIDNPANFSYVRPTGNWTGNEVIVVSANTSNSLVASSIITLNINKQENDTYKVIVTGYDIAINQNRYAYSFQYSFYTATNNSLVASNDYVNQYVLDNYWKMGIFVYDFGTLTAAFQFLTKNVRNANIYVDGVLWSKANNID